MGWILIQPALDKMYMNGLPFLIKTGVCKFDSILTGAWLQPIAFGSRAYAKMEGKLHFFVGKSTADK